MTRSNKSPTTQLDSLRQEHQEPQSGRIAGTTSLASSASLLPVGRHSGAEDGGGGRWRLAAASTTVVLVSLMAAVGVL